MPPLTRDIDVTTINLSDPSFWEAARTSRFASFRTLRNELPVSWQPAPVAWAPRNGTQPHGYWAVTRYNDVRAVHRDPQTFLSGEGVMLYDNLDAHIQYLYDGWISLDAPRHTALRRHISHIFTPRMILRIEQWVAERAERTVKRVASLGECDLYRDVVAPLPVEVMHDMLGVPTSDRGEVSRLVRKAVRFGSAASFEDCLESAYQVREYAYGLVQAKRSKPAGDLMTAILGPGPDGSMLSDEDAVVTFWMVLTAGSDTMALAAAHGMAALAGAPAQREAWQADYDRLADVAVEEILRWSTPVISLRRTAARDTEIAGQSISAGDNVLVIYTSANRDERVFEDPDRFDITRRPNPHVTFGPGGPHLCLGANLARMELKAFFRELFRQLPDVEVTGDLVYAADPFIDDVTSLPCRFKPRSCASNADR